MKHKGTGYTRWDVPISSKQAPTSGYSQMDFGTRDKGPAPPPPLREFDLEIGDPVKVYDSETFRGQWRVCEVTAISDSVVACKDARIGVTLSFRIMDYLQNDGVVKILKGGT